MALHLNLINGDYSSMKNKNFYCYSKRLAYFIRSFNVKYLCVRVNKNSNTKYYIFEKSDRLDKIISLYNQVKHAV